VKVTKRQRTGLVILALGLGALAIDRLVLQPGVLGPKQAAASGEALAPLARPAKAAGQAQLLSVAALIDAAAPVCKKFRRFISCSSFLN